MKFYEQIFLKESSILEKKEQALNSLIMQYSGNNNLREELFKVQKGIDGERKIAYQLSKTDIGMYILHDINFKYGELNAQIDYIVLTSKACYFIEIKNYMGNIKIDENGNFIREYVYNGKKIKKGMDSPIRQVEAQMEVFKKIALANEEKMKYILDGNKFLKYFKTLVVFADEETIIDMEKAPQDIKDRVLRYDGLIRKIKQINQNQDTFIEAERLKKLSNFILSTELEIDENYEEYYKNKFNIIDFKKNEIQKPIFRKKNNIWRKIKFFLIIYVLLWIMAIIANYISR